MTYEEVTMKARLLRLVCCPVLTILLGLALTPLLNGQMGLCTPNGTVIGPAPPPPPQSNPNYFPWIKGKAGDQSTVQGQHSGLVGWPIFVNNGVIYTAIDDVTFATAVGTGVTNVDGNGNDYTEVPLVFVFGECFGGGMIDDIDAVVSQTKNPTSIVSASFFNQRSLYPLPEGGNDLDFIWAYDVALGTLNNPTALTLAEQAAANDPFGWAADPSPPRNGEVKGSETPEYYSSNNGDGTAVKRDGNEANRVILWAGIPEPTDDYQLSEIVKELLDLGFKKENIIVFFGAAWYSPANSRLVTTMQAKNFDSTHLRQATAGDLQRQITNWAFPPNSLNPPKFFFFLAADHGCNNAVQENNWEKINGQDALPEGGEGAWGNGPGSQDPD
jgi:hypothetical protein